MVIRVIEQPTPSDSKKQFCILICGGKQVFLGQAFQSILLLK